MSIKYTTVLIYQVSIMNLQKKLCLSVVCFSSCLCSAETILTRTDAPDDSFINKKIDLNKKELLEEILVNRQKN